MNDPVTFGLFISAIDAAIFLPQAFRAWKFRNDPTALKGISTGTMLVVLFAYSCWIAYDAWVGHWEAHAYAWIGIPTAIFILAILYRARKLKP